MAEPTAPLEPPYYVVVFTSKRTDGDNGYGDTAARMMKLAAEQPGYLGVDTARGADGLGITAAYFESEESIAAWRQHAEHRIARETGRAQWYESFTVHVAKVERSYGFTREA